jgi:hypothetical protein
MRNLVGDQMSSAGGNNGEEGCQDAGHLTRQFLSVFQKHHIENSSRTESVMIMRNNGL